MFQLFAYRDGELVDSRGPRIRAIDTDDANQAQIQTLDLDADGDDDIYFGRYARAFQVYINEWTAIPSQRDFSQPAGWSEGGGISRNPTSERLEMAVRHVSARLYWFGCAFK